MVKHTRTLNQKYEQPDREDIGILGTQAAGSYAGRVRRVIRVPVDKRGKE